MNLVDYLSNYTAQRALSLARRTIEAEEYYTAHYIAPYAADISVDDVTPADILRILTPPFQAGHTRTAVALWVFLRTAAKHNPHFNSVMQDIPKPKHRPKEIKILTAEQLAKLLDESPAEYRLIWVLAGVYGLRRGEICGLQWCDIDTDGIHIQRQRITTAAGTIAAPLKSSASRRTLPITPLFLSRFEPLEIEHLQKHTSDSSYIIPLTPNAIDHALQYCLRLLRLPSVSLHSLRHTAASLAVNSADPINMRVLQSILGHASIDTTARIYSHVSAAAQRAALNTIATTLRRR